MSGQVLLVPKSFYLSIILFNFSQVGGRFEDPPPLPNSTAGRKKHKTLETGLKSFTVLFYADVPIAAVVLQVCE